MHINKNFEYITGLLFRNFTVYDDLARFYGYDDTEVDVTNVDGLVERIKSCL